MEILEWTKRILNYTNSNQIILQLLRKFVMEEWLAVSMAADKPRPLLQNSLAITMLTHLHIMRLIRVVYSIFLPYTIFIVTSYHQSVFTCHGLIVQYLILCNAIIPLSICIWFLKCQVWNIHFSPFKTRILQATTGKNIQFILGKKIH